MTDFMDFQGPTFAMNVPTNWFITSSPKFQAIFIAPDEHQSTQVKSSFIISMRRVKDDVTLPGVIETVKQKQQKDYPEYEILEEGSPTTERGEYFLRQYKWYDQEKDIYIRQDQAFHIVAPILYTLTATRKASVETAEIEPVFMKMIQSFKTR